MEIFNARNLLGNIIIGQARLSGQRLIKQFYVLTLIDTSLIDIDEGRGNISLTENISVLKLKKGLNINLRMRLLKLK